MSTEDINKLITNVVEGYVEDYSFEEFLELFDITPAEAFICLFESGLVDEELFREHLTSDA